MAEAIEVKGIARRCVVQFHCQQFEVAI